MDEIRTLTLNDELAFRQFNESLLNDQSAFAVGGIEDIVDYSDFVSERKLLETESQNPDWSPMTTYYFFRDGVICGKTDCRWELDKGNLATIGGHIGYTTAPAYRQQGIMTELLAFSLDRYRERGIVPVLITAAKENLASRRTIEKQGGQFESYIEGDNRVLARYWIK